MFADKVKETLLYVFVFTVIVIISIIHLIAFNKMSKDQKDDVIMMMYTE